MTTRNLRNQFRKFSNKTEQPLKLYSGALGIYIGGTQYVDVPNRPGFVYVRLRNNISELIQAHNQLVSPVYDLPVLIVRKNSYYEIYSRDSEQYASYWNDTSSYLPRHGSQHQFDPDNGGGGDLVFIHGEQFYPLMGFPSGSVGSNIILVAPYRYYFNASWHYAGNTGTIDLLQYRPTGSANSRLLLIGLDARTGNSFVKIGNEFDASVTGAAALTAYVPAGINTDYEIPGTIVRLVTGTTKITWANIYDARQYMGMLLASTGSFGGSFLSLNDTPDTYIGQAGKVPSVKANETGLEFVTVVNTFLALVDTPNSYASQANKFVAVKGTEDGLEFVNAPSGGGGGSSGLAVYDNGVFIATGSAMDFSSGLTAVATGTTVYVNADMVLLQNITIIDTGTSTFQFSNIPSGYRTLSFKGSIRGLRGSTVDTLSLQLNGLTGVVYSYNRAVGLNTGWTFTAATGTSVPISATVPAANTTPIGNSFYLSFSMDIPGYAIPGAMRSGHGQWGSRSGVGVGGYNIGVFEFEVDDINQITQVTLFLVNGNLTSGSYISMYGML